MATILPNTEDQLIHGKFVTFEYIKEAKNRIEDVDMLDLLQFYAWGLVSEIYPCHYFAKEKFKKLGGLGALVNSGKKIYVMSLDVHSYYNLEETVHKRGGKCLKTIKEVYILHPILERGLHPNAIDAYYSVNDQIKRMINSESFQEEWEAKRYGKRECNPKV